MKKVLFIFLLSIFYISSVSASTGYIDTSVTNHAKVCYDTTCTSPTPSIINFELSQQASIVVDSVTGVSGYVWGESLGWIKMNPTGAGVTFANSTTGILTGKAWSQVSGWINFAVTGQQVTISPSNGEFSGFAWSGGPYGGWIKFDCSDASTCVKTTWRVESSPPPGYVPVDVCPNIDSLQASIPYGYSVNNLGHCIQIIDTCPNLLGDQTTIPVGYELNQIGACIPVQVDYCQNIIGNQNVVPPGYIVDSAGSCVKTPVDVCPSDPGNQSSQSQCSPKQQKKDICPNLPGIQEVLPDQHTMSGGICYPALFDLCPNIDDDQTSIPIGYGISEDGSCQLIPEDMCDNLGGSQVIVPQGFTKEGNNCFFIQTQEQVVDVKTSDGIKVLALPFIPSAIWVVSDNEAIKSVTKIVDKVFGTDMTSTPYHVDLISFNIVILVLLILLGLIIFFIKRLILRTTL